MGFAFKAQGAGIVVGDHGVASMDLVVGTQRLVSAQGVLLQRAALIDECRRPRGDR